MHRGFGCTIHSAASSASPADHGAPAFTASVASGNPRVRQMTEGADDKVADAIRERAGEVEELGAYIGFYEWCAFADKYGMRVEMPFDWSTVDVASVFAPEIPFEHARTARVCAVRCGDGGRLLSATPEEPGALPRTNHFVIRRRAGDRFRRGSCGRRCRCYAGLGRLARLCPCPGHGRELGFIAHRGPRRLRR